MGDRARRRPAADPARTVRSERRSARGDRSCWPRSTSVTGPAKGSLVEASLFDAALPLAAEAIVEWTAHQNLLERDGNRSALAAPQGVYRCDGFDAWLAVSVTTDEQWRALTDVLGWSDLAADPDAGVARRSPRRARPARRRARRCGLPTRTSPTRSSGSRRPASRPRRRAIRASPCAIPQFAARGLPRDRRSPGRRVRSRSRRNRSGSRASTAGSRRRRRSSARTPTRCSPSSSGSSAAELADAPRGWHRGRPTRGHVRRSTRD